MNANTMVNVAFGKEYLYEDIHGIRHYRALLPHQTIGKRCDLLIEHRWDPNFRLAITSAFKSSASYKIAGAAAQSEFNEQYHVRKSRYAPTILFPIFEAESYGSVHFHSYMLLQKKSTPC